MARGKGKSTPPSDSGTARHSIADHALGALFGHVHAPGEEHDHDHDHDGMDLLPGGSSDHVALTSIGIDVGSSGTQVAFARLTLERGEPRALADGAEEIARLTTRRRETLYQSPIYLTPYTTGSRIDEEQLGRLIDHAFSSARLTADDIDCGVVILTGAARERLNADAIGTKLAEKCGDIVSASAGHHMEARLAAHGSGAVARSAEFAQCFLNIDIGGATTKLAVCAGGEIIATAALAIGGRLVVTDKADSITRLEPSGGAHAARIGLAWQEGGKAPWPERQAVGQHMAAALAAALTGKLTPDELARLYLTDPIQGLDAVDGIIVSGGVGEYVYGRETRSFSDLGLPLGRALAHLIDAGALPWPLVPAAECIRATVLGASSFSVQLSGRTGLVSNPADLLPQRNLPVLAIATGDSDIAPDAIASSIAARRKAADLAFTDSQSPPAMLAIAWQGQPEHARLLALAEGVKRGFSDQLAVGAPLYIMVDGDIAASLGALLKEELGLASDLLVLDGIALSDLDLVDLGRIRLPSNTVPVTIKTLVFRDERGQ